MSNHTRLSIVRCFLLDMDGTFYLGDHLIEGAFDFIRVVERRGCDFLFLTNNSSKNSDDYAAKLTRLGFPVSPDKIITSGQATVYYLQRQNPESRVFLVGTPSLEAEFQRGGFCLDERIPDLVVMGFDTTLTYAKLRKLCDFVRAGVPYLATHPDINCPTETGYMPDIGAMIAFVAASTGRRPDVIIGKPNHFMVEAASKQTGIPLHELCMIGDRLYTDIAMGSTAGITTILVLSGESKVEEIETSEYKPDYVFPHLGALAGFLENIPGN